MSLVKRNLIANFIGKGIVALINIIFVPLYINFLGIEAYGLVGFFITLQSVFAIFDLGLTTTLNRELARYSASSTQSTSMRNLVRTLEVVYWGLAFLIGIVVIFFAPLVAGEWIRAENLPTETVENAMKLMGVVIAFRWPLNLYSGGLLGLQRHVLYNIMQLIISFLYSIGVLLILRFVSATISAYFLYQAIVSILGTFLVAFALWRSLPADQTPPHFQISLLSSVWRFTAGMSGISVVSLLLVQADKVIMSRLLSLEMYGYYMLSWTVANSLYYLVAPIFNSVFPNFSQKLAVEDTDALKYLYHTSSQLMSVVILPLATFIIFFAPEILFIWTKNLQTVENTYIIVRFLIASTAIHGLMHLPYALQLAHGWTSLTFYKNLISVIVLVPMMVVITVRYGIIGAVIIRLLISINDILITPHIMHSRLLPDEKWLWYAKDVGYPLVVAVFVGGCGRLLIYIQPPFSSQVFIMLIWAGIIQFAALIAAPDIRKRVFILGLKAWYTILKLW